MWKSFGKSTFSLVNFLSSEIVLTQQTRTVLLFKRRYPVPLYKKGAGPHRLKAKHYVYDVIKDTSNDKQPKIDVILTSFIDGLGNAGDTVNVSQNYAYINLLLPRLAVYANAENLEKYKDISQNKDVIKYSSSSVKKIIETLEKFCLSVIVSKENPWILKPWHVRAAFRRKRIIVPEDAIELPPREIKGPDMSIQDKEFYVTITINNTEKVNVRCRLHHWSKDIVDRVPHYSEFWLKPTECIYPEFAPVLAKLPSRVVKASQEEEMNVI